MGFYGNLQSAEATRKRTNQFALRVMKMCRTLPKDDEEARIIRRQVVRSATSVGANYRAVCRAQSNPSFISKMSIVVEEIDETVFWFELLVEGGFIAPSKLAMLLDEGNQLLAMFAASLHTARRNRIAKEREKRRRKQ
jgi:four helix bundle protein